MIYNSDDKTFILYKDLEGNPVERTKEEYPYNYDTYVVWKKGYIEGQGETIYSDRLHQWDSDKYNKCCEEVWGNSGQYFSNRKPNEIEKFLSLYLEREIELKVILEGCKQSNGYPFWVFIYE